MAGASVAVLAAMVLLALGVAACERGVVVPTQERGNEVEVRSLTTFLRHEAVAVTVAVTAAGAAGAATGTGTSGYICGHLHAIHVDYGAGISTTTDLTVSQASPALTVMVQADSVTDAWYYPAVQRTGADGAAISAQYDRAPVCDELTVSVAESTAGTSLVTFYWGE